MKTITHMRTLFFVSPDLRRSMLKNRSLSHQMSHIHLYVARNDFNGVQASSSPGEREDEIKMRSHAQWIDNDGRREVTPLECLVHRIDQAAFFSE
jgi:hypothetical protein